MAEFKHLALPAAKVKLERRKQPAPQTQPIRSPAGHAKKIGVEANAVVAATKEQPQLEGVDPALILVAHMQGSVAEDEWQRAGFSIIGSDANRTLVLCTKDTEMVEFKRRLELYQKGTPADQKTPKHSSLFAFIDQLSGYEPVDRIGPRLRERGISSLEDFEDTATYNLDIELWDSEPANDRWLVQDRFKHYVASLGGEVTDTYTGESGWMLARLICSGAILKKLLALAQVRSIDDIPQPDIDPYDAAPLTTGDFDTPPAPPAGALRIGLIDSGISANPLIAPAVADSFGVPTDLGDADDCGHGTKVGSICVYGDVAATAANGGFNPAFWICSAKVVDENGEFPKNVLVQAQMRQAIEQLHHLGCRIINISLGDKTAVYDGGRVSPWAATLDELAREFDILIIVSAGNADPRDAIALDHVVNSYPAYLTDERFRIVEPATACNVVTVGAIAHTNGLPDIAVDHVALQPIASEDQPSPLTRTGPGVAGATKPDLVDYGGTLVFDGHTQSLKQGSTCPTAGVTTLNADYLANLFARASGTSYAAPLVTFKAALLQRRFPDATANLLRALLVTAADVPASAFATLSEVGKGVPRQVCGYGLADVKKALSSEQNRVILFAEGELEIDEVAIYEIDMLKEFRETKGKRHIRVTLAFDPPVRRTRADYLGVEMDFRLARNMTLKEVTEFFRKRDKKKEGRHIDPAPRQKDNLLPGPEIRDCGTLQSGTYATSQKIRGEQDIYYLVVRCKGKWADTKAQRFAVVVELSHEKDIRLHQRLEEQIRLRGQQRVRQRT
jgi:hypothetical protein